MVKRFQQKRWWGLAVLAGTLALLGLVFAQGQARAAKEDAAQPPQTLVITENKVLHSPEELAQELQASGMDEALLARLMEMETRPNASEAQGVRHEDLRSRFRQWGEEPSGLSFAPRSGRSGESWTSLIGPLGWGVDHGPTPDAPLDCGVWAYEPYKSGSWVLGKGEVSCLTSHPHLRVVVGLKDQTGDRYISRPKDCYYTSHCVKVVRLSYVGGRWWWTDVSGYTTGWNAYYRTDSVYIP